MNVLFVGKAFVSSQVEIQAQDQFGAWKHFQSVSNTQTSMKFVLEIALRSPQSRPVRVDLRRQRKLDPPASSY
jgi:hypothetical protein